MKTLAALKSIVVRYMLFGMLLFPLTMGNPSAVHAQGAAAEAVALPTGDETSNPLHLLYDDDCGEDDGGAKNIPESASKECPPRVWVTGVWTADESLHPKTSFVFGQHIRWVITVKNTTKHTASVNLNYVVKDPSGKVIWHSEISVSVKPGESIWPKSGVVPSIAGTYSFTGSVEYRDFNTRKTAKYQVSSPCHTLTTGSNPGVGGTVIASPAPNCNSGTQYTTGTVVNVTANANSGYAFSEWSGAITGSINPAMLTMTGNKSVTAKFVEFTGLTAGLHDDTAAAWSYTGDWSTATNAAYYNGTSHSSTTVGSEATVAIDGSKFILYYTGDMNHGSIDVYVDDMKMDTIDQYSVTTVYQKTWTSPVLESGLHALKFVHADGTVVDIDAIEIVTPSDAAAPSAISDLTAVSGATTGTVNLSWTAPGDDNNIGTATSYFVRYSTATITDQAAWNAATPVTTGIPTPLAAGSTQTMIVSGLIPSLTYFFAVRAEDEEMNLGTLSNSPSAAAQTPAPVLAGSYDDAEAAWTFIGNWTAVTTPGPYKDTDHYSYDLTAAASVTFTGSGFIFKYIQYIDRGNIEVWLDGVKVDTINANNNGLVWQSTYTKNDLSNTTHTVVFRHGGPSDRLIDIDSIRILVPIGAGVYDDIDPAWNFTGTWTAVTTPGPYNDTDHYSYDLTATASVTFAGTGFSLKYIQYIDRGNIEVWLDGVKVDTINANSSTLGWQSVYTRGGLSNGIHTVAFKHGGPSGNLIDIDSIQILAPATAGIYDDTDPAWSYTGSWTTVMAPEAYNGTVRYSSDLTATASFTFTGTGFSLKYIQYINRGNIEVWLDGSQIDIINANGSLVWQSVYTKSGLSNGDHTVIFKHGGPSDTLIDIDSIEVSS